MLYYIVAGISALIGVFTLKMYNEKNKRRNHLVEILKMKTEISETFLISLDEFSIENTNYFSTDEMDEIRGRLVGFIYYLLTSDCNNLPAFRDEFCQNKDRVKINCDSDGVQILIDEKHYLCIRECHRSFGMIGHSQNGPYRI